MNYCSIGNCLFGVILHASESYVLLIVHNLTYHFSVTWPGVVVVVCWTCYKDNARRTSSHIYCYVKMILIKSFNT